MEKKTFLFELETMPLFTSKSQTTVRHEVKKPLTSTTLIDAVSSSSIDSENNAIYFSGSYFFKDNVGVGLTFGTFQSTERFPSSLIRISPHLKYYYSIGKNSRTYLYSNLRIEILTSYWSGAYKEVDYAAKYNLLGYGMGADFGLSYFFNNKVALKFTFLYLGFTNTTVNGIATPETNVDAIIKIKEQDFNLALFRNHANAAMLPITVGVIIPIFPKTGCVKLSDKELRKKQHRKKDRKLW